MGIATRQYMEIVRSPAHHPGRNHVEEDIMARDVGACLANGENGFAVDFV